MSGQGNWVRQQQHQQQQQQQLDTEITPFINPPPPTSVPTFDTPMEDISQNVTEGSIDNDDKKDLHGIVGGKVRKIKKKKTVAEKNLRMKKNVKPKNAVMCLNELRPGIVYNTEADENGMTSTTRVSVEVDGKKFIGAGTSKQNAKQNAAEAALMSFVQAPSPTGVEGGDEDKTPWAVLACFAMYKLFNRWMSEDRISDIMAPGPGMISNAAFEQNKQVFANWQAQAVMSTAMATNQVAGDTLSEQKKIFSSYLGKPLKETARTIPNAAKKGVPANATSMHPMMLLHQMHPGIQLSQTKFTREADKQQIFKVNAVIDDREFSGEGTNMKKAKFDMAIKANTTLFGVECTYTQPQ